MMGWLVGTCGWLVVGNCVQPCLLIVVKLGRCRTLVCMAPYILCGQDKDQLFLAV